jgi:hypothetical protein
MLPEPTAGDSKTGNPHFETPHEQPGRDEVVLVDVSGQTAAQAARDELDERRVGEQKTVAERLVVCSLVVAPEPLQVVGFYERERRLRPAADPRALSCCDAVIHLTALLEPRQGGVFRGLVSDSAGLATTVPVGRIEEEAGLEPRTVRRRASARKSWTKTTVGSCESWTRHRVTRRPALAGCGFRPAEQAGRVGRSGRGPVR